MECLLAGAAGVAGMAEGLRPRSAAARAAEAFLTPRRTVPPPMLPEPPGGTLLAVPGWPEHLVARLWGGHLVGAPAVLLLHGWDGEMHDLMGFVQPLLDRGFRVVAFDAPGHGRSAGDRSSLIHFAQAAMAVAAVAGPLAGAIGHSLGGTALVLAAEAGTPIPRLALIGAPARPLRYARQHAAAQRLDGDGLAEMLRHIAGLTGRALETISLPGAAARLTAQGLVVHALDDRIAPVSDALEIAGAWPGARVHLVEGLGHRRLLRDPGVVAEVVDWMAGSAPPDHVGVGGGAG